jgi:hypothetical protein
MRTTAAVSTGVHLHTSCHHYCDSNPHNSSRHCCIRVAVAAVAVALAVTAEHTLAVHTQPGRCVTVNSTVYLQRVTCVHCVSMYMLYRLCCICMYLSAVSKWSIRAYIYLSRACVYLNDVSILLIAVSATTQLSLTAVSYCCTIWHMLQSTNYYIQAKADNSMHALLHIVTVPHAQQHIYRRC